MGGALIDGVIVTPLKRIANPKGDILHALKRSAPGFAGFGEAYFSSVQQGAVKGWKRHRRITLNVVVPVGTIRFVIGDGERFCEVTLGADQYARLTVRPGLWMAFQGRGPGTSLLLNVIDEEHDAAEAEDAELRAFPFEW